MFVCLFVQLKFLKEEKCAVACIRNYTGGVPEDEQKLQLLKTGMQLSYQHSWIVGKIYKFSSSTKLSYY